MNIKNLIIRVFKGNLKSSKLNEEEDVLNTPGLLSNEYQKKLALIISKNRTQTMGKKTSSFFRSLSDRT